MRHRPRGWPARPEVRLLSPELERTLGYGPREVRDGIGAEGAHLQLIDPATPPDRGATIAADLRRYCALDTVALQRLVDRIASG